MVDIPVERMTGRPVERTCFSRSWSVRAAEGILWQTGSKASMKSTDGLSQTEANQCIPRSRQ